MTADAGLVTGSGSDATELREPVRRFCEERGGTARLRAVMETPDGYDAELWREVGALGWAGIDVPEELGGGGGTFADLAVVLQELGRHLTPVPMLSTVLATGALLLTRGDDHGNDRGNGGHAARLRGLVAGELSGTAALSGPGGRCGRAALGVESRRRGRGFVLDGAAAYVPDAHRADVVVVAAREDDGVGLFAVDRARVGVEPTPMVDRSRRLARVTLDAVELGPEERLAGGPAGETALAALGSRAAAALAADAVGGAERVLEMTVDHARQRVQFGRPIGSFQAVKHRCTDMLVDVETSRVVAGEAARLLADEPHAEAGGIMASMAKARAGDAYVRVAADGVQLHGGIGFTWEHDMHLHLKRAKLDQALLGDPAWHRRRVADHLLATRDAG